MDTLWQEETLAELEVPEIPMRCQYGDVWQLGEHKLLCGDSTSTDDVARLFDGEQFTLCFTSPPYSNQRSYKIGEFNWHSMMCSAFDQMIANGKPDCHILVNLGLKHENRQVDMYWFQWLMYCSAQGWPLFGWYVWDQGSGLPGEWGGRLAPCHEFLFHFNQQLHYPNKWIKTTGRPCGSTHGLRRDNVVEKINSPDKLGQSCKIPNSVIHVNREYTRGIHTSHHPAVFPIALPEFVYKSYSNLNDIIFEPFCGSGTSLLAAEKQHRRCYAIDIEPTYCDLAIERWQRFTGKRATCLTRREEAIA